MRPGAELTPWQQGYFKLTRQDPRNAVRCRAELTSWQQGYFKPQKCGPVPSLTLTSGNEHLNLDVGDADRCRVEPDRRGFKWSDFLLAHYSQVWWFSQKHPAGPVRATRPRILFNLSTLLSTQPKLGLEFTA